MDVTFLIINFSKIKYGQFFNNSQKKKKNDMTKVENYFKNNNYKT